MSNQNLKVDHKTVIEEFKRKHNYLVDGFNLETVHKMTAPTSMTLTDEEVAQIIDGVFVEGEFGIYKNPVFFPARYFGDRYYQGVMISPGSTICIIGSYLIDTNDNSIALNSENRYIGLNSLYTINGKEFPAYPANDVDKYLKCEQGNLKWKDINLADIVDSQGNKRFVEGNITLETITGITQTYGKWSLSGTHLMMVIGISLANNTVISGSPTLANFELPNYIFNKIEKLYGNYVMGVSVTARASDTSGQTLTCLLRKDTNTLAVVLGSLTLTSDRNARIQFDLLIDTDAPVSAGE